MVDNIETHKAGDWSPARKAPRQKRTSTKPPKADKPSKKDKPSKTDKPTLPAVAAQYVVVRSGMGSYGGGVHTFKAGQIISDPWIINQLKAANADFIEPVGQDTIIRTCPHCKEKLVLHASDLTAKK